MFLFSYIQMHIYLAYLHKLLVNDNSSLLYSDCIHTVKTPAVVPGKKSQSIPVGKCDHGPLEFSVQPATDGYSLMVKFIQ